MPVVLITGANRGIGLEFARQYAKDGWEVLATARQPDKATELAAIDGVETFSLDVCDPESIDAFVAALAGRSIDLFINNAGVYGPKDGDVNRDDWRSVLEANTIAPFFLTMALKPLLASGATVATLTSKMGSMTDNTSGGSYIYRSSKAAVNAVMKSLAHDLSHDGIKVVLLHPGWVKTDMGGPNALITVETSVSGMRTVIAGIGPEQSGAFFAFDGAVVPW